MEKKEQRTIHCKLILQVMLQHFSFKGIPCMQVTLNIREKQRIRYRKTQHQRGARKKVMAYHVSQEIK
jgi:hypothetical protein